LLAFGYLLNGALRDQPVGIRTLAVMLPSIVALIGVGVMLLLRHTLEMTRLRQQLEALARGRMPEGRPGGDSEDFVAVTRNLSAVIKQTDARIRGIESSSRSQLRAEQQRVMMETVGAACHHLGQPLTVMAAYLDLMGKRETDPEVGRMIAECQAAAVEASAILRRLHAVTQYRTEPYLPAKDSGEGRPDARILKI
jgi:signal transduction histidine kinase